MSVKPPSQRQMRVAEELRHALARVLARGELDDPVFAGANITVTEVQLSPDLKNATAFVTPLGGAMLDETVAALNRAAGYFRGQIAREVRLRHTPRIDFKADVTFEQAMRVSEVLNRPRVRRDLESADRDQDVEVPPDDDGGGHGA